MKIEQGENSMIKNISVKKICSGLVLILVVMLALAGCGGKSQHKYTVTYEAQKNTIGAQQLTAAENSIKGRFEAINYNGVTVTQEGSNKLKVEVSGDQLVKAQAELIGQRNEIKLVGPDKAIIITNADIVDAVAQQDPKTKNDLVLIKFTQEGKNKLIAATTRYIGKPISIYLDDELISAPVVQAVITDGQAAITGTKFDKQAKELAAIIKEKMPLPCAFNVTAMTQE